MFRNPYADGLIVLVIVLLFFGPKRLPTLGRSLGQGLREFKDSITGDSKDEVVSERPELTAASAPPVAAPTTAPSERQPVEASRPAGDSAERSS
ncbi:MAG: twin-arginine translocase TatA/TatE family subunit [Solirubrobacteraceae bacterium]|jgi:sec-independent protein translocase protein TatA